MQIELKNSHFSHDLVIIDDNVKIVETVSESIYEIGEDGKKNFRKRLGEDIASKYLHDIFQVAEDMIYYRKKEYDSSSLIEQLIQKMPEEKRQVLIRRLSLEWLD